MKVSSVLLPKKSLLSPIPVSLPAMTHFIILLKQIANGDGTEFSLSKNCAIASKNERLKYTSFLINALSVKNCSIF